MLINVRKAWHPKFQKGWLPMKEQKEKSGIVISNIQLNISSILMPSARPSDLTKFFFLLLVLLRLGMSGESYLVLLTIDSVALFLLKISGSTFQICMNDSPNIICVIFLWRDYIDKIFLPTFSYCKFWIF